MTVHPGPVKAELQGKRVYLYHGDGLIRRDVGYRLLKRLLRNPVNQSLYKLLPAGFGMAFAAACSASSRRVGERLLNAKIIDEYRRHALDRLNEGNDIVYFGHSHCAELSRWGDKIYCNTGAWMRHFNYATLSGGNVRLWRYRQEGPEEIPAIDRNTGSSAS
jgi:UDP-2,3-diacylglucosamine hydrolase